MDEKQFFQRHGNLFAEPRDGGKSFSVATPAYQLKRPFSPPQAYRMAYGQMTDISNDTSLAVAANPSSGATYYLSFVEGTEKGSDVLLMSCDAKSQSGQNLFLWESVIQCR